MTPLALVISISALIVSIWAILSARSTGARQSVLQEQMLRLEAGRERDRRLEQQSAKLVARINRNGDRLELVVANRGVREARAIETYIDDEHVTDSTLVPQGVSPVSHLGPDAEGSFLLAAHMGSPPVILVRLEWEDDSGIPGRWSSQLNIF